MYRKIVLDNGLRVVCEKIPYVRSISIGIWIGTGSRNEDRALNGVSHFIEHMVFKGTRNRSAKEIAEAIDNIGGQLNAFTGKECTCYYTKTLDSHYEIALEVLSDMLFHSRFLKKDIDVERKVIVEEIGMYEDSPEELVHDILSETVWEGDSLGYPILGTAESLDHIDKKAIQNYMEQHYTPANSVISIAGNFDDDKLLAALNRYFGNWNLRVPRSSQYPKPHFGASKRLREKDTEQVHICLGFNGIEQGNDNLYPLMAINNVFGGGMSSRLFQKIREEKGLVYSIYTYPSTYQDAGLFTVYAGMKPEHMETVLSLIVREIRSLLKDGISSDDLQKSKEQLKGSYILGLESTSSRMNSIGKSELLLNRINTPEEILDKIDAITLESVRQVIDRVFILEQVGFTAVGSIRKDISFDNFL